MSQIDKPGFYPEISEKSYHADPCATPSLSRGIAHTLITKSPLHAQAEHPRLSGRPAEDDSSEEMDFGDVAHQIILGKGAGIAVGDFPTWRGAGPGAFWDQAKAAGKTPCLMKNYKRATEMAAEVQKKLDRRGLGGAFSGAQNELVGVWQEDDIWCRMMLDAPRFDLGVIYDLKTTTNVHPDAVAKKHSDMGADMQAVFYTRGVCKLIPDLLGRLRFITIYCETQWPHAVLDVELNGEFKQLAEAKVERAIALWRLCMNSGKWAEYSEDIVRLAPKPWMMTQELERQGAA